MVKHIQLNLLMLMRGDSFVGDNEWKCLELMCLIHVCVKILTTKTLFFFQFLQHFRNLQYFSR
jgi:uncharacterized membrane protein YwzB